MDSRESLKPAEELGLVVVVEGWVPAQEDECQDAHGPHVDGTAVGFVFQNLRRDLPNTK